MKATKIIDAMTRNAEQANQMGVIYGDLCNHTADVTNFFGCRVHIVWGDVLANTNYAYIYGSPLQCLGVKDADGEEYDAELLTENEEKIYLYRIS